MRTPTHRSAVITIVALAALLGSATLGGWLVLRPILARRRAADALAAAIAARDARDYQGAIAHLDRAIALDPGDAEAHAERGTALIKTGEFTRGMTSFMRAAELEPARAGELLPREGRCVFGDQNDYLDRLDAQLAELDDGSSAIPLAGAYYRAWLLSLGYDVGALDRHLATGIAAADDSIARGAPSPAAARFARGRIRVEVARRHHDPDARRAELELAVADLTAAWLAAPESEPLRRIRDEAVAALEAAAKPNTAERTDSPITTAGLPTDR